jgi:prefoldin subunit 5
MKERIEARLAELREEFETGQHMLADLDDKREKLRESMLRIAGAIQVLEEMAGEGGGSGKEERDVLADGQP